MKVGQFYLKLADHEIALCVNTKPMTRTELGEVEMLFPGEEPIDQTLTLLWSLWPSVFEANHPIESIRIRVWNTEDLQELQKDFLDLGVDVSKFETTIEVPSFVLFQLISGAWIVQQVAENPIGHPRKPFVTFHRGEAGRIAWKEFLPLLKKSIEIGGQNG